MQGTLTLALALALALTLTLTLTLVPHFYPYPNPNPNPCPHFYPYPNQVVQAVDRRSQALQAGEARHRRLSMDRRAELRNSLFSSAKVLPPLSAMQSAKIRSDLQRGTAVQDRVQDDDNHMAA